MLDSGRLTLTARWDGCQVAGVDIDSTRPQAARALVGCRPEEALARVPLLFSVCSRAQGTAARAAWEAACGRVPGRDERLQREAEVTAEAAREHLWRLLLDWPALLGLPSQRERFARWHRRIAAARAAADWAALGQELEDALAGELLGLDRHDWCRCDRLPAADGAPPLQQILAAVQQRAWQRSVAPVAPLPSLRAAEVLARVKMPEGIGPEGLEAFARRPSWNGQARETGAVEEAVDHQSCAWRALVSGQRILGRLMGRVQGLFDCALRLREPEALAPQVDAAGAAGRGASRVRTARGTLLHWLEADEARVARYAIIAPTEWNFHPQGAFVSELAGLRVADPGRLREWMQGLALALDPCVAYEINVERNA